MSTEEKSKCQKQIATILEVAYTIGDVTSFYGQHGLIQEHIRGALKVLQENFAREDISDVMEALERVQSGKFRHPRVFNMETSKAMHELVEVAPRLIKCKES